MPLFAPRLGLPPPAHTVTPRPPAFCPACRLSVAARRHFFFFFFMPFSLALTPPPLRRHAYASDAAYAADAPR